jgi:CRP/FNR family cyclic AMP-dependent transcriptional regulator
MGNEDTAFRVRSSYERSLEPGETVFSVGDRDDRLYVIQVGAIEVVRERAEGHQVVARLGPGDFFGELSLVCAEPRTTRAVAVAPTRVLELDPPTLEGMCMAQPEIAIRMLRVLVGRLFEAERKLAALAAEDMLRPLVRVLTRGAQPAGPGQTGFRVPTTLRAIAEETGLSLLEAHRGLHQLFDRKVVQLVDEVLLVPDLDALSGCLDPVR